MSEHSRPTYHFTVQWGGAHVAVEEVSGLGADIAVIEHREGSNPEAPVRKMPGLRKVTDVTLKRGIVTGSNEFFQWFNSVRMNSAERRDVVITLLNEKHEPVVAWKIRNAFPCKYSVPDLKACGNDVAIETLELAHEGFSIESA